MKDHVNSSISEKIQDLRASLGTAVVIPAHHYQNPAIVAHADFVGDSYKLAVEASKMQSPWIIFCGVRFMAESAAILAGPQSRVLLPDLSAGCPMADMAQAAQLEPILDSLQAQVGAPVIPITYMNSNADMKALTGQRKGAICTSGNSQSIVGHYLDKGKKILFNPDVNLGMNTFRAYGLRDEEICILDRTGKTLCDVNPSLTKAFLWDGYCPVHQAFSLKNIHAARAAYPEGRIIVHPECSPDVVQASDASGSTEGILRAVRDSLPGSVWIIGTEASFVLRLAQEYPDKIIVPLAIHHCPDMSLITEEALLECLEKVAACEGLKPIVYSPWVSEKLPEVTVDASIAKDAALSLKTMISITEAHR